MQIGKSFVKKAGEWRGKGDRCDKGERGEGDKEVMSQGGVRERGEEVRADQSPLVG